MPSTSPRSRPPELPYRIELWDAASDERRILARALNLQLARVMFRAATGEHPGSRVTLRRGNRIVADSAPASGEPAKPSAARTDG